MDMSTLLGLIVRHGLTTVGGYLAGKGLLSGGESGITDFVGAGMVIFGIAWSAYQKYGVAFVNAELARSRGLHVACGAVLVLFALGDARAADVNKPLVLKAPAAPVLDLANWSGFYAGIGVGGINQGADIITGGLGSINAGGTTIGVNAGYMNVTPTYLLGAEVEINYQTTIGVAGVGDGNRWTGDVELMAGGSLSNLFGTFQAPAGGGPFNLGTLFANAMPYAFFEPRIGAKVQTGGGVGIYVPLKGNVFLRGEYEYAPAQNGQQAFQYPRLKIGWAF